MQRTFSSTLLVALLATTVVGCTRTAGGPHQPNVDAGTVTSASITPGTDSATADAGVASGAASAPASGSGSGSTAPAAARFRFLAWGDTKVDTGTSAGAILQALSNDARTLRPAPAFTLYLGDLEETGFNDAASLADDWLSRLDGGSGNGTSLVTFVTRGNHDAVDPASTANWQSYFDFAGVARRIGATQYAEFAHQLTYSFDYANSHFVSLDVPGDFPSTVSGGELAWLDQDLADAEARGLTHAFLYWHGPIYTVGTTHPLDNANPEQPIQQLVAIAGRHPIVSAVLDGHEHLLAYQHIGPEAFPTLTVAHEFEQFTVGTGGAAFHTPVPGRGDAVLPYVPAFATVDVDGPAFTVSWYAQGNDVPQGTFSFRKP